MLDYAHKAAVHAELVGIYSKALLNIVSRDCARRARKDVREAIKRLQTVEQLLSRRVMS